VTILLFIIGVLMVAVTGRLVARAIAVPRIHFRDHLREIADYGFVSDSAQAEAPSRGRLKQAIATLAAGVGRLAIEHVTALPPLGRGQLAAAGHYDVTPETVHGYRALASVFLATVVALLVAMAGAMSLLTLLLVAASAALGWRLPAVVINSRGSARLGQIDLELPELIDLLIATVEAGMGFSSALALVANRLQGPLGDEVRLTMRQQNLGISTTHALEDMLDRCDTESMRAFVRTVTRGESLGLSIAPILRDLAHDMRRRRRQAAQERMHKAPIKILFPMMFLIMPALMIVLFYPAVYSVMSGSGGL
jgi:tight adherence protein C